MKLINDSLSVIQFNLQIQDTGKMDPVRMAESVLRRKANAVVLNTGGIYAWYRSEIPFHHINEYLPQNRELLEEIIQACHDRNIAVIGRFDFSKADDTTYLQHPEWFVQTPDGEAVTYGSRRMGSWSLLMSACLNSGYRNEAFAVPVLQEAIRKLPLDGIFLNAPHMEPCWCERCRRKYRMQYHKELPREQSEWERSWASVCVRDNVDVLNRALKAENPDIPLILYYGTYQKDGKGRAENLDERYAAADMICTEAQNIISLGKAMLPDRFKPTLNMKLGQMKGHPKPFGIIHSCPGMDWRHTGMPRAEYEYWMSQIIPAGGQIWHSLTGFEEVITDKRIAETVEKINHKADISAGKMKGAEELRSVLLLWDAHKSAIGYAQALIECHIPFAVMDCFHVNSEEMKQYPIVMVPDGFEWDEKSLAAVRGFAEEGGTVWIQHTESGNQAEKFRFELNKLLGISQDTAEGKSICAAYTAFEGNDSRYKQSRLKEGLEDMMYFPVRGNVTYARADRSSERLMYFVPPFAPADGVGAPPERASMPVVRTELSMLQVHPLGKGSVFGCFFDLSGLIRTYGLEDHRKLFENAVRLMDREKSIWEGKGLPPNVYSYVYRTGCGYLVHLVNAEGERPVSVTHPWYGLSFQLRDSRRVVRVSSLLEHSKVEWEQKEEQITVYTECLTVWDLIEIELE